MTNKRKTTAESRLHIFVSGMVQGVFFRVHAKDKADSLGLSGWVRNSEDGRVEMVAEGPEDMLNDLEKWCHRGAPTARVTMVEARKEIPTGEFAGFDVTL